MLVSCCEQTTVLTTWRTRRRTRWGTRAGRKLIRHIKCVRLTTASYKTSAYHYEPAKSLFNVNSFVNTSSSDFKSNSIKVIVRPYHKHARVFLWSINFHNLHVIDSLHVDQKVEVPLMVCSILEE